MHAREHASSAPTWRRSAGPACENMPSIWTRISVFTRRLASCSPVAPRELHRLSQQRKGSTLQRRTVVNNTLTALLVGGCDTLGRLAERPAALRLTCQSRR